MTWIYGQTIENKFNNTPKYPEMPWYKYTQLGAGGWSNDQHEDPSSLSILKRARECRAEDKWLMLDIEYGGPTEQNWYRQPDINLTLEQLEFLNINRAIRCKQLAPDLKLGLYWSVANIGGYDADVLARQASGLDPSGNKPGLIDVVDFVFVQQYNASSGTFWGSVGGVGYLGNGTRQVKQIKDNWKGVETYAGLVTDYYTSTQTGAIPYDKLDQAVSGFLHYSNADGIIWNRFQDAIRDYSTNEPWVRVMLKYSSDIEKGKITNNIRTSSSVVHTGNSFQSLNSTIKSSSISTLQNKYRSNFRYRSRKQPLKKLPHSVKVRPNKPVKKFEREFESYTRSSIMLSGNKTASTNSYTNYLHPNANITNSFMRIVNTHHTGMGKTSGGGAQNQDDYTVRTIEPSSFMTNTKWQREGSDGDNRVTWDALQYVGDSNGPNAWVVRDVGSLTTLNNEELATGLNISTIANPNRVCIFITGQGSNATFNSRFQRSKFISRLTKVSDGVYRPEFIRDGVGIGYVSYAVVEFVGKNWRDVQRLQFTVGDHQSQKWTISDINVEGSYPLTTPLFDTSRAFLHCQYTISGNDTTFGPDELNEIIRIDKNDTNNLKIKTTNPSGDAVINNKINVIQVIENTQNDAGYMHVEHITDYRSETGGSEELVNKIVIWDDIETKSGVAIMGETSSSPEITSAEHPQGNIDLQLGSITGVDTTSSRSNRQVWVSFDMVQWPRKITYL